MGEFHCIQNCDPSWVDFDSYTKVIFFSEDKTPSGLKHDFPVGQETDRPKMRKWIISNCRGEVYMGYEHSTYKAWTSLWFEYEEDAAGFKLAWLK